MTQIFILKMRVYGRYSLQCLPDWTLGSCSNYSFAKSTLSLKGRQAVSGICCYPVEMNCLHFKIQLFHSKEKISCFVPSHLWNCSFIQSVTKMLSGYNESVVLYSCFTNMLYGTLVWGTFVSYLDFGNSLIIGIHTSRFLFPRSLYTWLAPK